MGGHREGRIDGWEDRNNICRPSWNRLLIPPDVVPVFSSSLSWITLNLLAVSSHFISYFLGILHLGEDHSYTRFFWMPPLVSFLPDHSFYYQPEDPKKQSLLGNLHPTHFLRYKYGKSKEWNTYPTKTIQGKPHSSRCQHNSRKHKQEYTPS